MTDWQIRPIPMAEAGFTDPIAGTAVTVADPTASVPHWCDLALADRWLAYARHAWSQRARYLDDPARPPREVWDWVQSLFAALANHYNALNVCWYNDPRARALYREWIAGPPYGGTASTRQNSVFDAQLAYNPGNAREATAGGWWDARLGAFVPTARTFGGKIPGATKDAIDARVWRVPALAERPAGMFVQYGGVRLDKASVYSEFLSPEARGRLPAEYGREAINALFPGGGYDVATRVPAGYVPTGGRDTAPGAPGLAGGSFADYYPMGRCFDPARGAECGGPPAWGRVDNPAAWAAWTDPRVALFGANAFAPAFFAPPLVAYAPWAGAWIEALAGRSAAATVAQAIRYAVWSNQMQMQKSRMTANQFVSTALGQPVNVAEVEAQGQPGWRIAGAAVGAIGGGLAPFTFGASALVAALANVFLDAASRQTRNPDDVFKDDLGRWKPVLERTSLAGDLADPATGAPTTVVPEPPPLATPDGMLATPWGGERYLGNVTARGQASDNLLANPSSLAAVAQRTLGLVPLSEAQRLAQRGGWLWPVAAVGVGAAAVWWLARRGKAKEPKQ